MKLKSYLAESEMTLKAFSILLKRSYCYMSRIMNEEISPGKNLAKEIENLTQGKVKLLKKERKKTPSNKKQSKKHIES